LAIGLVLLTSLRVAWAVDAPDASGNATPLYSSNASLDDARFGSTLGAGAQWQSSLPGGVGAGSFGFGGGARLSCAGVDFNGFLRSFDPSELIGELKNSLLSGAQAAASDFLISLAYADPTVASVLDMLDKRYSARFSAFAQACNAEAARARGLAAGARSMADADDQCFGQEIDRGTAPTEAYRRCSIQHSFDGLDIPAALPLADFLTQYTHVNVTPQLQGLFALLPDERVANGAYQTKPPQATVSGMTDRLRSLSRGALERLDTGVDPATIPDCTPDLLLGQAADGSVCLPRNSAALVSSGAFQSSKLLGSASRSLFNDALSTQIAIGEMYSNLLDLYQQAAQIDVRTGATADAAHAQARQHKLREEIAELLGEVDLQAKAQEARAHLVRSQMLALEQVAAGLNARGKAARAEQRSPQFGMRDLLRLFTDHP
jgi:hypothetical protein